MNGSYVAFKVRASKYLPRYQPEQHSHWEARCSEPSCCEAPVSVTLLLEDVREAAQRHAEQGHPTRLVQVTEVFHEVWMAAPMPAANGGTP